jgi:hypothetical protein
MRYVYSVLLALILVPFISQAQFVVNSAASAIPGSPGCYVLTPPDLYQRGSIFNSTLINLNQNFEVTTSMYFGTSDVGADGMAFVFQQEGTSYLGNVGAGIGYHRFAGQTPEMPYDNPGPVPSFIIEFDTYQNDVIAGQNIGDPAQDHVGFMSNSNAYHTSSTTLKAPEVLGANIEDDQWHTVKFTWNATTKTMTVQFTTTNSPLLMQTFTYTGDIVNTIFAGNPMVYWGFTASTGSFNPGHQKICFPPPPPTNCGPGRTQTPGGWGADPHGNNPGTYLHKNFTKAFPGGVTIGSLHTVKFTTAQSITDYLPAGGKAEKLTRSYVNPTTDQLKNVLVQHILALTLSVGFDDADPAFSSSGVALGDMIIKSGPFANWTVRAFLAEANKVLGGSPSSFTVQQVLETATAINENYVDGKTDKGYLKCPGASTTRTISNPVVVSEEAGQAASYRVVPNPTSGRFELVFNGTEGRTQVLISSANGGLVDSKIFAATAKGQTARFDLGKQPAGVYLVRVVTAKGVQTQKVLIQK